MNAACAPVAVSVFASAPRDPDGLLAYVDRHRLAGFVTRADLTPAIAIRQRQAQLRALRHAAATIRAVQSFASSGIDAIPIKGALLSEHLYGDPTIRDVRDADLLIRPHHLYEADAILLSDGYQRTWPSRLPLHSRTQQHLIAHGYHFEYTHPANRVNLELHWRFPNWSAEAVDEIWSATEIRTWRGTPVRAINDDALLLLLLCDHGARHRWFQLKWLVDVATLINRIPDIRQLDGSLPLAQATLLCLYIFNTTIPPELRSITETPACRWLTGKALESINAPVSDYFSPSLHRQLKHTLYNHRLGEPFIDFTPRPNDVLNFELPNHLFWLHYPLRPLHWIRRHIKA